MRINFINYKNNFKYSSGLNCYFVQTYVILTTNYINCRQKWIHVWHHVNWEIDDKFYFYFLMLVCTKVPFCFLFKCIILTLYNHEKNQLLLLSQIPKLMKIFVFERKNFDKSLENVFIKLKRLKPILTSQ